MSKSKELTLARRAADAVHKAVTREDGLMARIAATPLAQRLSDKYALPQLYNKYRKNFLTHGYEFLVGDDELPLFAPGEWGAPLKWRPLPAPGQRSLSSATLTATESGTALLRGHFGGTRGEMSLLAGETDDAVRNAVGAGACGVASHGHWELDLAQHHWIELKLRSDARPYEIVLQANTSFMRTPRIWRARMPEGPPAPLPETPRGGGGGAVGGGAYGVLGVGGDASDEEIRERYRELVKETHPDTGGDEERFKRVSRAYALLSEPERRAEYDGGNIADDEGAPELSELGEWRSFKVPFTAFKDRALYDFFDQIDHMYLLLAEEKPGPFALEIGEVKAGRCEKAHSDGAGTTGHISCEQGHCECGFYNGLRAEAFEGPLKVQANGRIKPGALEWGYAEHHLRPGEFRY